MRAATIWSFESANPRGEMVLKSGSRLGPYEIRAPVGAGGMGEVYRAWDPKLKRDVALKVLPVHLSQSAEFLARFEREAQTLARLSHPNILSVFDFGKDDAVSYAVMELLEGENLGDFGDGGMGHGGGHVQE